MAKYRITFFSDPTTDIVKKYDVEAKNSDEAFEIAYKMPEARNRMYRNVGVEEIPTGDTNIGIRFSYKERGKTYYQYMVIHAKNESHAKEYYNRNIKGRNFYQPWPRKPDDNGNCIYGAIAETYFAACPGYDFDATK